MRLQQKREKKEFFDMLRSREGIKTKDKVVPLPRMLSLTHLTSYLSLPQDVDDQKSDALDPTLSFRFENKNSMNN